MSKQYTILGFGKSARTALDFLLAQGHKITVYDSKSRESFDSQLLESYEGQGVGFDLGLPSLRGTKGDVAIQSSSNLDRDDIYIVSPGIPPSSELIQNLKKHNAKLKTDLDLFTSALSKDEKYIAITGTNGKTTCTSLIAHIFDTEAIGNIGKPFLEFQGLKAPYVCEISSFQIFYSELKKLPDIAIYLNLTADHLDWHSSMDEYKNTKARLFQNSSKENFSILNFDDQVTKELGKKLLSSRQVNDKSKVVFFSTKKVLDDLNLNSPISAYIKDSKIYLALYLEPGQDPDPKLAGIINSNKNGEYFLEIPLLRTSELKILGEHNYSNVLAAVLAAFSYDVSPEFIAEKLKTFKAVPHRLEFITELEGHKVFNDSKATNPDSAIRAIESFDKSILIMGGKNKYLDLSLFLDRVTEKCDAVILIGELKDSIAQYLDSKNFDNYKKANNLQESLDIALEYGKSNKLPIVLSPASSSFDMFKSYEDRGAQFKKLVIEKSRAVV